MSKEISRRKFLVKAGLGGLGGLLLWGYGVLTNEKVMTKTIDLFYGISASEYRNENPDQIIERRLKNYLIDYPEYVSENHPGNREILGLQAIIKYIGDNPKYMGKYIGDNLKFPQKSKRLYMLTQEDAYDDQGIYPKKKCVPTTLISGFVSTSERDEIVFQDIVSYINDRSTTKSSGYDDDYTPLPTFGFEQNNLLVTEPHRPIREYSVLLQEEYYKINGESSVLQEEYYKINGKVYNAELLQNPIQLKEFNKSIRKITRQLVKDHIEEIHSNEANTILNRLLFGLSKKYSTIHDK